MSNFICVQCGTQFSVTATPPETCPICTDERQYVRHEGQAWTTMEELAAAHHNRFEEEAGQLLGIGTEPDFAIGQRALLLQLPEEICFGIALLSSMMKRSQGPRPSGYPGDRDFASALLFRDGRLGRSFQS